MATTTAQSPLLASSVMQRDVVTLLESDTIQDAVDKLTENHVSAIPIVTVDGQLVGVLTVSDLLRLVQDAEQSLEDRMTIYENCFWLTELIRDQLGNDEVTTAMSGSPVTARPNDPLQRVAKLMLDHHVHHIPITDADEHLVGIISSFDFVRLATNAV
ncbi:inosine 5'-monophosphate dehydrogenase [Rubripirellula lacrimiformis]|uniref:Inosine 5'-monophosphate dehydrogenase n=1 Tax=Rubripirellula lacrimiformis TaxID=1930273 RepID=A0A517N491_9BACT|nr:CBS domain-containing protein [Rubripirellula lacrimiformis]QDT01951.1 inosine 5'-monophosphate dehydrogenase [Rubripirellula lacrimiformis]